MLDASEDDTVKVIIVGDGYVGKTSLLRRFVRGDFTDQYRKTIGAEFLEKDVFLRDSNSTVKLMLWDTAGQEVFNALTQAYYRGAGAAVLVFSTVDSTSFQNIPRWKERVEAVCGPITMVLCQSKLDLSHEAAVTTEEAEGLARTLKVPLYRISSKDDFNVTQLFEFTAQQCLSATDAEAGPAPTTQEPPSEPARAIATEAAAAAVSGATPAASPAVSPDVTAAAVGAVSASASPPSVVTAGVAPAASPAGPHGLRGGGRSQRVSLKESGTPAADRKKRRKRCTLL